MTVYMHMPIFTTYKLSSIVISWRLDIIHRHLSLRWPYRIYTHEVITACLQLFIWPAAYIIVGLKRLTAAAAVYTIGCARARCQYDTNNKESPFGMGLYMYIYADLPYYGRYGP